MNTKKSVCDVELTPVVFAEQLHSHYSKYEDDNAQDER
jgi:hypothetical protein